MKHLHAIAAAVVALTATVSSHAAIVTANFAGKVVQQTATTYSVGSAITGQFTWDTAISKFLTFKVGTYSIGSGFSSQAVITPDQTEALYRAQISPVSSTVGTNSTFALDLESLTTFPSFDAIALLTNSSQLSTNLDIDGPNSAGFPSFFSMYTASASGNNVQSLTANLTTITAAVPEPGSLALVLAGGMALMGARRLTATRRG